MANFVKSDEIKVFPAGFRKDALDTSKLTTEENLTGLTILSSDKDIGNRWITNPLNDKETIIYIKGYKFVLATEKIPKNCNWAAIKLRDISITANNATDNGNTVQVKVNTKVLKPVESTDAEATNLDEKGNFLGLGFYENEPSGNDIYKVKKDSSLVLNSSEIKDGASNANITEQFTTKKIIVSGDSYNININENGVNDLALGGVSGEEGGISIITSVGSGTSLTVSDDVKVNITSNETTLGNIKLTKEGAGIKINDFNLPNNASANMLLASNGTTNSWIEYSADAKVDTIVKRSGNDIKTDTLNDVRIWLDKTTPEEPILKVVHDFVKDGNSLRSGLGIEWPATLTVSSDGSIQTDINNDGTNVISIGAGTLIKQDKTKNFVQIGNIEDAVEKVITLPFDDTLGADEDSKLVVLTQNVRRKPDTTVEVSSAWRNTASAIEKTNANKVAVFNDSGTIEGLAPTNHSTDNKTIAETYGLATDGVYGHVKLRKGTLGSLDSEGHYRDENYADGVAASIAHNHDGKYAERWDAPFNFEGGVFTFDNAAAAAHPLDWGDSFFIPHFSVNNKGLLCKTVVDNVNPFAQKITLPDAYNKVDVKNMQGTKLYLTGAIANNFTPGDTTLNYNTGIYVGTDNNLYAPQLYLTSDKRLKENERPYKSDKSILDLPIYKYDYINGSKNQIGCMAQDLKEICPEIVEEDEKGYLHIQESKIVYLLIEEIKKLKEEIKNLKK